MSRKRATLADLLNDLTFRVLYDKYKLLSLNEYEYEGLPESIHTRHIERELFSNGIGVIFKDPDMSYMALKAEPTGKVNYQNEPTEYRAVGVGYSRVLKRDECVIIRNNILGIPTEQFIMFYANKLAEAERTMDVNVKANKTPVIVLCDDKDVLSFKRLISQADGNVPAIYADKNLNVDAITTLDTRAKFLCNELMVYKNSVENELLTFLGQNNANTDKRERLITDEANANNELIESFADLGLVARQEAIEECNKKFGWNASVRRRYAISTTGGVENVEKPNSAAGE